MTEPLPDGWDRAVEEIAEARRQRVEQQADRRREVRAEFKTARDAGLRIRHATKLARIHAAGPRPGPCGCTEASWCPQHWQALPVPEKRDWRRRNRDAPTPDVTS